MAIDIKDEPKKRDFKVSLVVRTKNKDSADLIRRVIKDLVDTKSAYTVVSNEIEQLVGSVHD